MFQLCDHYGLERGDWYELARHLAVYHVPGFRHAKATAGRKSVWTPLHQAIFALACEGVRDGIPTISNSRLAEFLAQDPIFAEALRPNVKGRVTLKQLADALRKRIPKAATKPGKASNRPPTRKPAARRK